MYVLICLEVQRTNILPALLLPVPILQCNMILGGGWGNLYYRAKIHTLQKKIIRITVGAKNQQIHLKMWHPLWCITSQMYVYSIINHTQQATCKCILAISFCSKSEPSSGQYTRTDKTEALYIIWMASPAFHCKTHCKYI